MFERTEIEEQIYEGVFEPAFKNPLGQILTVMAK